MNIREMFPSKWLRVDDLKGKSHVVVIARITEQSVGERQEKKWVIWFEKHTKGLVLNKGNALAIARQHGEESNDWIGKPITIFPGKALFQGKWVASVKVDEGPPRA